PPSTSLYTLSLHDALPIYTVSVQVVPHIGRVIAGSVVVSDQGVREEAGLPAAEMRWVLPAAGYGGPADLVVLGPGTRQPAISVLDRKSTRLNSSHVSISYA